MTIKKGSIVYLTKFRAMVKRSHNMGIIPYLLVIESLEGGFALRLMRIIRILKYLRGNGLKNRIQIV